MSQGEVTITEVPCTVVQMLTEWFVLEGSHVSLPILYPYKALSWDLLEANPLPL